VKNSAESHIVLDCSTERIHDVLKQAQQIGMMSDYHSYLITSLDLHSVDLEEFKYGGTNITALRLVDPEKPELQKVVQNWVYGELRYGRKVDLPPPRVRSGVRPSVSTTSYTLLMYALCNAFRLFQDNLTFIKVSSGCNRESFAPSSEQQNSGTWELAPVYSSYWSSIIEKHRNATRLICL
jgi:hypothetical protein